MQLSAMDDNGSPVDWWFAYKVAGKSASTDGSKATGTEYVYFDANSPADGKLTLSPHRVDKDGALPNTLNQLYAEQGMSTQHLGWFFYNDENPINGNVNGSRGHTKGVLAFDLGTNTAFWLIQSTPLFPPQGACSFPDSGMPNAQTLLCITLQDATVAQSIARQMFAAQQPNVYLASKIPVDLENNPADPRVELMNDQIVSGNSPVTAVIPFLSKAGTKFMSIAKNKYWGLDFYNDLVGPTLHDNLDVETWEHGTTPLPLDSDKIHTVVDMAGIDLKPLGIPFSWPEPDDHAKLAISARSEVEHYICVGDINFTVSMRKRSGGTVAFQCDALWSSISEILVGVTTHLKPGSKAAKQQAAHRSASAAAAAVNNPCDSAGMPIS
jgi:deoxyribonuclease-2